MTRREWLGRAVKMLMGAVLAWPVMRFVLARRYRPPRKVRIRDEVPQGGFLIEPEFVLFQQASGPLAVSRTCTHLGCKVTYDESMRQFICPCHQSRFHWNGRYISGPAKKDLPKYPVEVIDGGKGYIVFI